MPPWLPYLLTCASAIAVTYYRVYASDKFHNLFFFVSVSEFIWIQAIINAVLGALLLCILKDKLITIGNNNTSAGDFIYPIVIGTMIKGVSDINLFNVKTNGFSFPVGLRTITQPMDSFFDVKLDGVCFNRSMAYLLPFNTKYTLDFIITRYGGIAQLKQDVISLLEDHYPDKKKVKTFAQSPEFLNAAKPGEILRLVLQEFGKTVFETLFPV